MDQKEKLVEFWRSRGIVRDEKIIKAFLKVKRENFVPEELKEHAYDDVALPLAYGSAISQPTTIMVMLQALELKENVKMLEVGAGSGYTAALIKKSIGNGELFSIDIISELVDRAKKNLERDVVEGVTLLCKDGKEGLEEEALFDRILVNAASREVPKMLMDQLKEEGILVIPVGPEHAQKMVKLAKYKGKLKEEILGDFMFVKLK